jgi:hypothetical protein
MSLNNAIFAPKRPQNAILASILRKRLVATRTSLPKLTPSFQDHAFVKVFITVFHPSFERLIL